MKKILIAVCCIVVICSCNKINSFEKTVFFPKHEWDSKVQPNFQFEITDTVAAYHIYVVIRHEDAYHYSNLWLNVSTTAPGEKSNTQKVNLQLANNTSGWLGTGMDDIFDHRIRITKLPIHLKKGIYQFNLQQIMREDPLGAILNAGIRVEKINP
ncbi:MAG: gliding motility lipoprotein GldH [Chitinophagaceae bacterium]|nr:gliding motility lipoprotein GldH [Chitinophagaceae bacterium]